MNTSFRQKMSDMQISNGFIAGLQIVDSLLTWMIGFVRLTEEEQRDAGIYFGK